MCFVNFHDYLFIIIYKKSVHLKNRYLEINILKFCFYVIAFINLNNLCIHSFIIFFQKYVSVNKKQVLLWHTYSLRAMSPPVQV